MQGLYRGPYWIPYIGSMSFWLTRNIDRSSYELPSIVRIVGPSLRMHMSRGFCLGLVSVSMSSQDNEMSVYMVVVKNIHHGSHTVPYSKLYRSPFLGSLHRIHVLSADREYSSGSKYPTHLTLLVPKPRNHRLLRCPPSKPPHRQIRLSSGFIYGCTDIHIYISIYTHRYIHKYRYIYTVHIYMYIYIYTHTHTLHIHIEMYRSIYIYTHT